MGMGISLFCEYCAYKREWLFGEGELYNKENLTSFNDIGLLDNIITSKREKRKLKKLFNEYSVNLDEDYGYRIYECRTCKRHYNRFRLKYIHIDGEYEVQYICSNCKDKLSPIENSKRILAKMKCPKCKRTLFLGGFKNWD